MNIKNWANHHLEFFAQISSETEWFFLLDLRSRVQLEMSMDRVGLYYFIIIFDPIRLNSGQKILTYTRSDPCKIIKYLLIIFI
jgi:hypothetical protein